MNTAPSHIPSLRVTAARWLGWLSGLLALACLTGAQAQTLTLGHLRYLIGEDITAHFSGGPGNAKDWVGIYPDGVVPSGNPPSTIWQYVDGTQGGATGLTEGTLTFTGGLQFAGDWKAFLLKNDGYEILAEAAFTVVEAGTPLVRAGKSTYAPGEAITVSFINGPGNPADWIGVYKEGQTPGVGGVSSTIWNYVGGSQAVGEGKTEGTVSFPSGLGAEGNYVVFFLLNDGYDVLASEAFRVVVPAANRPRVLASSPANGAANQPPVVPISVTITNGATKVAVGTVALRVDGQPVTPSVVSADNRVVVTYTNTALYASGSTHTYKLTFKDDGAPPQDFAVEVAFTIGTYENLVLPAPIVFENFDGVAEGALPAGWTAKSYTDQSQSSTELDFGNLDSASYANWVVVNVDRFTGSFVTYSNPGSVTTDYRRVLTPNPFNVVNGQVLTGPLASGRMIFGDSGYRNGSSQVMFLFTPDFDLTGKSDVHLVFHSLWEQNQDSLAAVEYSVDAGATWLPVAYFLNSGDIVRTEGGEVDAEATFNTEAGDIARYTDDNGTELGGTYGAFIAAPVSPALAPFIQGRLDDNATESKRVEKYRLPQADGKKTVRFRFAHAGTDSWYWGLDNFGLYSIGGVVTPPVLTVTRNGESLTLAWTGTGTLQGTSSLTAPDWQPVAGAGANQAVVPVTGSGQWFRVVAP